MAKINQLNDKNSNKRKRKVVDNVVINPTLQDLVAEGYSINQAIIYKITNYIKRNNRSQI